MKPRGSMRSPSLGGRLMAWLSSRPSGTSRPVEPVEVLAQPGPADVLEHADRADGVEGAVGDVAVVLQPDLDLVGQALGLDAGAGPSGLLGRHGDADGRARRSGAPRGAPCRPSRIPRRAGASPASARACGRSARTWPPGRRRGPVHVEVVGVLPDARTSRSWSDRAAARRTRCPRRSGGRWPMASRRRRVQATLGAWPPRAGGGSGRRTDGPGDPQDVEHLAPAEVGAGDDRCGSRGRRRCRPRSRCRRRHRPGPARAHPARSRCDATRRASARRSSPAGSSAAETGAVVGLEADGRIRPEQRLDERSQRPPRWWMWMWMCEPTLTRSLRSPARPRDSTMAMHVKIPSM